MMTEKRWRELLARIPYLLEENNGRELTAMAKEFDTVPQELNDAIYEVKRRITSELMSIPAFHDKIIEEIKTGDREEARRLSDAYVRAAPFSKDALFFRLYLDTKGKYKFIDRPAEDSMADALLQGAGDIYEKRGEYEKAYQIYAACQSYYSTRALRYRQGTTAMEARNYAKAAEYFARALDYRDAEKLAACAADAEGVYKRFIKEVPNSYLADSMQERYGDTIARYEEVKKIFDSTKWGFGYLSPILILVACAISVLMHWDPEWDAYLLYIAFALILTFTIHKIFFMDFSLKGSGIMALGCFLAPRLIQLGSIKI